MRRYLAVAPAVLAPAAFGVPAAEAAPSAVTGAATSVTSTGVTLNGTADAGGVNTVWFFELAPQGQAASLSTDSTLISGAGAVPVSTPVTGLAPGTAYRFSLVAIDANGDESDGAAGTFATPALAPLVTGASQVTGTTAVLHGVLPGGSASGLAYEFEYGPTAAYGSVTFSVRTPQGAGLQAVSASIRALAPGTVYHYRVVVIGSGTASPDGTFSTGGTAIVATPGLTALPADGVDASSALLHASFPPGQDGTFQFEYG